MLVDGLQELFCSQFAAAVGRIRLRGITLADFLIGLLFLDSPENAETAHEDKSLQGHLRFEQRLYQVLRAFCVDAMEVGLVQTLRHTSRMYHVVELMPLQLFYQLLLRREVEFDEVDALVLQERPGTAFADGSPGVEAPFEGLFYDK